MPAFQAYADDFGKITIWMNRNFYGGRSDFFYLTSSSGMYIDLLVNRVDEHPDQVRYDLTSPADMVFGVEYMVHDSHGLAVPLQMRMITHNPVFMKQFDYAGDDLGSQYHLLYTDFNLWAPTATNVVLRLINYGEEKSYKLTYDAKGVWRTTVNGDLSHAVYTYYVTRNGETVETLDPYALSSTANGRFSAVIDTDVLNEIPDYPLKTKIRSNVDAIIYECHVRDVTSAHSSGTRTHGKFLPMCEDHTEWKGYPTGLAYFKELGITHLQLQPVLDYATVDELHPDRGYNWGYDPAQYIALEGSYATNPKDPYCRMKEFRQLVTTMHKNDIRVTLDVVFNHMYDVDSSPFARVVPYYYYRYNDAGYLSNGSYCGNDLNSNSPMMRRYFIHVCEILMRLYGVDGYRFDLMGVLDVETMNEIHDAVKKIRPDAIIYGEGWDMPTILDPRQKACIVNQDLMPEIGHFNDFFRDTVKGKTSDDQKYVRGYITGDMDMSFAMCSAISGNVLHEPYFYRFSSPCKTINSVETHDNGTAWDKMRVCNGNENHDTRLLRMKMLIASTLFSIGVPFLHAGEEFCGTKNDNSNSYNAGDAINQMNWDRAVQNRDVVVYTEKAIKVRKNFLAFHLSTGEQVANYVHPSVGEGSVVFMDITCEDEKNHCTLLRVIFNPTYDNKDYYEQEQWLTVFDQYGNAHETPENHIYVPGLSVIVAVR